MNPSENSSHEKIAKELAKQKRIKEAWEKLNEEAKEATYYRGEYRHPHTSLPYQSQSFSLHPPSGATTGRDH